MNKFIFIFLLIPAVIFANLEIAFIGDSITNGYGVQKGEAFPDLVQKKMDEAGKECHVITRAFNGAQTDVLGQIVVDLITKEKPQIMVICTGVNDIGLGVPLSVMEDNLQKAIWKAGVNNCRVILGVIDVSAIMPAIEPAVNVMYCDLVFKRLINDPHPIEVLPFWFLNANIFLNFSIGDHLHPNAAGHELIAQEIFNQIQSLGL